MFLYCILQFCTSLQPGQALLKWCSRHALHVCLRRRCSNRTHIIEISCIVCLYVITTLAFTPPMNMEAEFSDLEPTQHRFWHRILCSKGIVVFQDQDNFGKEDSQEEASLD